MKIDSSHGALPPMDPGQARKAPVREEGITGRPEDHVELSHRSLIHTGSAARAARIEQLRTEVQNGTYRAEAKDIAHAVVNEMLGESSGKA